jgi:hypothetical protein
MVVVNDEVIRASMTTLLCTTYRANASLRLKQFIVVY